MIQNRPIKKFGQHFLKDPNILRKIVDEINPQQDDIIIEIGPGYGALTGKILTSTKNFFAVEIDKNAINHLEETFPNLTIINHDFLTIELHKFLKNEKDKLRVVGNIPYNITSPILFKLIEHNSLIEDAVLMVQFEVAKRITAKKSNKDYGILAVLLNFFAQPKMCFKISPNVFYPKPNVDSALMHIRFNKISIPSEEQKLFIDVVKASFGNRRKILKNSLSNSIFHEMDFSDCGIDLSLRAENLDINDFQTLTQYVKMKTSHAPDFS